MVSPVTPLRRPTETTVTTGVLVFRAVIAVPNEIAARPTPVLSLSGVAAIGIDRDFARRAAPLPCGAASFE
jgi:hypothetical protein